MRSRDHRSWLHDYNLQSLVEVRALERLYSGVHRETGRRVMIRQLLPGIPESERIATAEVVAAHLRRLSALTDPLLLPALEYTASPDGPLYLVTDVPRGSSLGELIAYAGTLPLDLTATLGTAIAKRLRYAHSHGVAHLALHRGSILLRPDGDITITDLGLASMWFDRLGEKLRQVHSAWNSVYPDPGCVPPEVLAGEPLSEAADVYGLGALLFCMATMQSPYQGQSVVAYNSILSAKAPPDPRAIYADVDDALAEIIMGCLRRVPEERTYQTMNEVIAALGPHCGVWPDVLDGYQSALKDFSWLERAEPRLTLVNGGEGKEALEEPTDEAVVPLFSPTGDRLTEAELLAAMTSEQRAIYLAGERSATSSRRPELHRAVLLGTVIAVLVGAFILPDLWLGADRARVITSPSTPTTLGAFSGATRGASKAPPPAADAPPVAGEPSGAHTRNDTRGNTIRSRGAADEQPARSRYPIVLYLDR